MTPQPVTTLFDEYLKECPQDDPYFCGIISNPISKNVKKFLKSRPAPLTHDDTGNCLIICRHCGKVTQVQFMEAAQAREDLFTLEENEHMVVAIKAQEGWSDCEICKKVLDTLESLRTGGEPR